MWARRLLEIALGFLILAFWPARAAAVDVQQFLMPGPLIQGHAKYEQECSRCHEPFHKTAQRTLCLNCHNEIAADLAAGRGFHGRSRNVKSTECRHCHTDHKGRDVDIVLLDREVFNHAVTDFRLEGAHKRVACIQCHTAKAKYRDAPSTCIACHKAVDPHHGRLGEACADLLQFGALFGLQAEMVDAGPCPAIRNGEVDARVLEHRLDVTGIRPDVSGGERVAPHVRWIDCPGARMTTSD